MQIYHLLCHHMMYNLLVVYVCIDIFMIRCGTFFALVILQRNETFLIRNKFLRIKNSDIFRAILSVTL